MRKFLLCLLVLSVVLALGVNSQSTTTCVLRNAQNQTVDLTPLAGQTYIVPNTAFTSYSEHIALCGTFVSTVGCPANSAACEVSTTGSKTKVSSYPATLAVNAAGSLQMTYTAASSCQNIVITFVCDTTGAVGTPVYVNENCVIQLRWTTTYACFKADSGGGGGGGSGGGGGGGSSGGLSGGDVFLILFFLGGFLYLVIGAGIKYKRYDSRGWDLVPNIDTWREVPALIKDGCIYTYKSFMRLIGKE